MMKTVKTPAWETPLIKHNIKQIKHYIGHADFNLI